MEFPTEAAYGRHDPATLSHWDGRDEYEDVVREGSNEHDVEVERAASAALSPRSEVSMGGISGVLCGAVSPRSLNPPGVSLWSSDSGEDPETPGSPHVDTALLEKEPPRQLQTNGEPPSQPLSPSSAPSLMMDLSDLETSLNEEVGTVKDWLKKVKAERDRLRKDKAALTEQLRAERQGRAQLQAAVEELGANKERLAAGLGRELLEVRTALAEEKEALEDKAQSEQKSWQKQLESLKEKNASLEEALVKEKSSSTLREANKLEEARKEHFAKLTGTIQELEARFARDMKEMSAAKAEELEIEKEAHAETMGELSDMKDEKELVAKELQATHQELETLKVEHEQCGEKLEEAAANAHQAELFDLRKEAESTRAALQDMNVEAAEMADQLESSTQELVEMQAKLDECEAERKKEREETKENMKRMCDLVEVANADAERFKSELKENKEAVERLTKSNEEKDAELMALNTEVGKKTVEIDTLHEARHCFEKYEAESKAEIQRLREKLEATTSDILKVCQSGSDASEGSKGSGSSKESDSGAEAEEATCNPPTSASSDAAEVPAATVSIPVEADIEVVSLPDRDAIGFCPRKQESEEEGESGSDLDSTPSDESPAPKSSGKKNLAVPHLDDADASVIVETEKEHELHTLRERLEAVEKERDSLRAISQRERNALKRMVDTVAPDDRAMEPPESEVSELKAKLAKAEEAYVKSEVEKCEKLATLTKEKDALSTELRRCKAGGLIKDIGEKRDMSLMLDAKTSREQLNVVMAENERLTSELKAVAKEEEVVEDLQEQLAAQAQEIDALSNELTTLQASSTEASSQLEKTIQAQADAMERMSYEKTCAEEADEKMAEVQKENEKLTSELIALRTAEQAPDITSVAVSLGKEMEEMKTEHRVEIKLMKKEHAAAKTKAKILAKEKAELAEAFEVERASNNELESSLEEMVNLLEDERAVHLARGKESKIIKKKLKTMSKKRVPVDAAHKAALQLLEKYEQKLHSVPTGDKGHGVDGAIKLIEGLSLVVDENAKPESSLASITQTFSADDEQMEELAGKCEVLEIKVRAMKLKIASYSDENSRLKKEIDDLAEAPSKLADDKDPPTSGSAALDTLRKANRALSEKSKSLARELVDSTKAFEETIASYESVIAKLKTALAEKKQEKDALRGDLEQAVAQGKDALNKRKDENKALKNDLAKAKSVISELEEKMVVGIDEDTETIGMLEKLHGETLKKHERELNAYREAVEVLKKKLEEGHAAVKPLEVEKAALKSEVDRLKNDFSEVISQFEEELTRSCEASEVKLRQKCDEVDSLRKERDDLNKFLDQLEGSTVETSEKHDVEIGGLQSKLKRAMLSLEESQQGYDQLRAECTKTKEEKEAVIDKLTARVGSLTESRNEALQKADEAEAKVSGLQEEVQKAEEERQLAAVASESTEKELQKATTRLDDMLTYSEKMKAKHESIAANLKKELDEMRAASNEQETKHEDKVASLQKDMDAQMKSMNEVVESLKSQVVTIETEKEMERKQVETLRSKHSEAESNLDSLTDLVANLKSALESEKENASILLSQFKKSEEDRKSNVGQKEELETELASRLKSESVMTERIRNLEGVEQELASRMKSEAIMTERIRALESELHELRPVTHELSDLRSKLDGDERTYAAMQERMASMEAHSKSLQHEFKSTIHKKDEEASKMRVTLQEAKDKLSRLWNENDALKQSMKSMQEMLNEAIHSRGDRDASLQESLQLLEQQKRIDIKRKGEIAKLEQTVEILKSKEQYLESYVASLKKQIRRG